MSNTQIEMYIIGFYALLGIAGVIGIFKTLDWLVSQKYVSHTKCEKCRAEIYKTIATDHDLLRGVNAKVDLIIKALNLGG